MGRVPRHVSPHLRHVQRQGHQLPLPATDRTHRIGQKNDVTVVKLIARDTIEERILKMQEMKQDLADKIIAEVDKAAGQIESFMK